jgi:hypothetical protein
VPEPPAVGVGVVEAPEEGGRRFPAAGPDEAHPPGTLHLSYSRTHRKFLATLRSST